MIRNIALALTIAAISTSAAAQSKPTDYTWLQQYITPYEAKTIPADPNAPVLQAGPQLTRAPLLTPGNSSSGNSLLDGCVISAVGRLPKAEGLRVTNSSTEFRSSWRKYDFYNVVIAAELDGRNGTYQWICRVYDNTSATLIENR